MMLGKRRAAAPPGASGFSQNISQTSGDLRTSVTRSSFVSGSGPALDPNIIATPMSRVEPGPAPLSDTSGAAATPRTRTISGGQSRRVPQLPLASGSGPGLDHPVLATHPNRVESGPALLVDRIVARARQHAQLVRAEVSLIHQVQAIARLLSPGAPDERRRTEAVDFASPALLAHLAARPLIEARAHIHAHRRALMRQLEADAKLLPVWPWVQGVRGAGPLSLAQIVGAAGDLANYDGPARLWKRFGLAVLDGRAQRRLTDKDLAALHGFSPVRRSLMHIVGENLLRQNRDGAFRTLYNTRKAYEIATTPGLRPFQYHRRALRYMEKRFLRELWRAWKTAALGPILTVHEGEQL